MNYQRKHRFYIMNQNNGDGIYMNSIWGPENYISYEEKGTPPPEHLTNILGLRMNDIVFHYWNDCIRTFSIIQSEKWKKCNMPEDISMIEESKKWTKNGYIVKTYNRPILIPINVKDDKYRSRLIGMKNGFFNASGSISRSSFLHRMYKEVGLDILSDIIELNEPIFSKSEIEWYRSVYNSETTES